MLVHDVKSFSLRKSFHVAFVEGDSKFSGHYLFVHASLERDTLVRVYGACFEK